MKTTFYFSSILLIAATTASCRQQTSPPVIPPFVPLFTPAECATIVQFWAQPNRCVPMPPQDANKNGLFRPHLSVAGSKWLLNYERKSQQTAPPTQNGIGSSDLHQNWNSWIQAKFAYDYAQAAILAKQYNDLAGFPTNIKKINLATPAPGPCPNGLAMLAGDPPPLADAAPIEEFKIHFNDIDLTYEDHVVVPPQYAYYRFDGGVNSEGTAVKTLSPSRIDRLFRMAGADTKVEHVFDAVSALEGGFDAVNTYDTGYVSVGFIQFATLREGGGSLGTMLLQYKNDDPVDFNLDFHQFGIDVTPQGLVDAVDPLTGVETQGPQANAEIIREPRLTAVFQRAGLKSDAFDSEQIKSAIAQFYPANDVISFSMPDGSQTSVKVGDFIHSEAGMATLTDRKVNTGELGALPQVLTDVAAEHKISNPRDLAKYELEIVQKMRYRRNYLKDTLLTQPGVSIDPTARQKQKSNSEPTNDGSSIGN